MALNKEDKIKIRYALEMFKGYTEKHEINNKDAITDLKIIIHNPLKNFRDGQSDITDEQVLRELAEQVFTYLKQYPELKRELKEKYFKNI